MQIESVVVPPCCYHDNYCTHLMEVNFALLTDLAVLQYVDTFLAAHTRHDNTIRGYHQSVRDE